jgi:acyl-CoA thioesterase I
MIFHDFRGEKIATGCLEEYTLFKKMNRFVWLLALLLLSACNRVPQLAPLSADGIVLAFGDSLTFGTGARPEESYPAVLGQLIGKKVVNAGVPGEVTAEGRARLPSALDEHRPALMILCLGGNDFLHHLDEKETEANLREMVRMARERGIGVLLVGVPRLGFGLEVPSLYRNIAQDAGIPLEEKSLERILADKSLKSDPIHPNAAGYRRLAEALVRALQRAGVVP